MRPHALAAFVPALAGSLAAQWCPVPAAVAPPASRGAYLASDVPGQRTLLFGGNNTNDFWQWDGTTWSVLQTPVKPGPRARAGLAHDALTGTMLLYGGNVASAQLAVDETWSWNGTTWQLVPPTATTPNGLAGHAMAFDLTNQRYVLFGGRHDSWAVNQMSAVTWLFQGGVWSTAAAATAPSARVEAAMAWHPATLDIVAFGGTDSTGAPLDDTWHFDGTTWTRTNTSGVRPPGRTGARMIPVLSRNVVVLMGGRDPVTMEILGDMWEYDGTTWTPLTSVYDGVYPPRAEFGLVHDVARDRMVLFGGVIANGGLQDDTWEYGACFKPFGFGCAGSNGTPVLTGVAVPKLGTTCSASLTNLVPAIPFGIVAVGLSRTQWSLGSLPMLLTSFGMPGCRAYQSSDLLVTVPSTGGVATWTWNVPATVANVGASFHLQGLSFDPGANAAWLTTSNATTMVIGY